MYNSATLLFESPASILYQREIKQPLQMLIKSKPTKGYFIEHKRLVTKPRYEKM